MAIQNDINGYRRSHKRIPTGMALADDENEMKARSGAVANIKGPNVDTKPNRVPLSSYRNEMNPIGSGASSDGPELEYLDSPSTAPLQTSTVESNQILKTAARDDKADWGKSTDAGSQDAPLRELVQKFLDEGMDDDQSERRVTRQRAAQEAMVRAQMGAGESGRSGAAALLQGEAGRLAESQARLAEQERKTQITGLATWLMGFDMNKERYDIADKQMAQQAAINTLEYKDLNYQDMMEFLQIPKSAWTKEGEIQFNAVRDQMNKDRGDEEKELADAEEKAARDLANANKEEEKLEGSDESGPWDYFLDGVLGPMGVPVTVGADLVGALNRGEISSFEDLTDVVGNSLNNYVLGTLWRIIENSINTAPGDR